MKALFSFSLALFLVNFVSAQVSDPDFGRKAEKHIMDAAKPNGDRGVAVHIKKDTIYVDNVPYLWDHIYLDTLSKVVTFTKGPDTVVVMRKGTIKIH